MKKQAATRQVKANGAARSAQSLPLESPQRDPRALARLDWIALGALVIALLIAPIWTATFATPPSFGLQIADSPFAFMDSLGIPLLLILTAVAFGIVVWREWNRPVAIGAVPGLAGAVILLGAWAALSLLHTRALYLSLNTLSIFLAALLLAGLAARLARDRTALNLLLLAIPLAGAIVAGIGINEYLRYWKDGVPLHRTFATFLNPDFLAGYLLLTLPVTLAAFSATTERLARLALGIGLLLQSACLLLTGSRGGVIVLPLALLAWLALAAASGAAAGRWKRIGAGLVILVAGALLASTPLQSRIFWNAPPPPHKANAPVQKNSGSAPAQNSNPANGMLSAVEAGAAAQSHSGSFRRWTWIGTVRMARANPLLGTGIGTFEVAYPHYAATAFTAHGHNSFLQWMGETGVPGALFLLTALAAATAFAAHVLLRLRRKEQAEQALAYPIPNEMRVENQESQKQGRDRREEGRENPKSQPAVPGPVSPAVTLAALFDAPRLILAGLLAATLASMLHSLFDSDWFVVATAFTLCTVVALLVAQARDLAPLAAQTPRPLSHVMVGIGALIAVFLLWRAWATGVARLDSAEGAQALAEQRPQAALTAYAAAADADPFDPEPHLSLAEIDQALQRPEEARSQLQAAVRAAPIGKTFYRLAQFSVRAGDLPRAIAAFRRAQELEPHNLQNLHALADVLLRSGQAEQAAQVFREMAVLENTPYGTVRAVPELVETEFAYAHAGLADIASEHGQWTEAAAEYARAAAVLRMYWERRDWEVNQSQSPDKREAVRNLYDSVLTHWQVALQKQGKTAEAARLAAEQAQFREERAKEQLAAQEAGQGAEGDTSR